MTNPRIILVDSDPAVRSALSFSLGLEGFAVEGHESAEALLSQGRLPQEGCLVLDFRLAGTDAIELLALLRSRGVDLPAVIMTSSPHRRLHAKVAEAGAVLVEKPLLCDALTAAVRRELELTRKAA